MELSDARVEATVSKSLPWEEVVIAPIGDVQLGSRGVAKDALRRHLARCKALNAYYLGMGDYIDLVSPSEEVKLAGANLHDSTYDALEERARTYAEEFLDLVKGTEGRWLGLLKGHHSYRDKAGRSVEQFLAEKLQAPLLGRCALVRLRFVRGTKNYHVNRFHIWCHHGAGGGQTLGATEAKMFRMMARWPQPDWFLVGHENKQWGGVYSRLIWPETGKPMLRDFPRRIAGTGAWVAGYVVGNKRGISDDAGEPEGTYVENRMLPPLPIGGVLGRVRPMHTESYDWIEHSIEV